MLVKRLSNQSLDYRLAADGMLRDAKIVPYVSQTAAEILPLISLVDARIGKSE